MAGCSAASLLPAEKSGGDERVATTLLLRVLSAVLFTTLAGALGLLWVRALGPGMTLWWLAGPMVIGAAVGFLGSPYLLVRPVRWYLRVLRRAPGPEGFSLLLGLTGGLLLAVLLTPALSRLPRDWGTYAPLASSLLLGLLGATTGLAWSREGERALARVGLGPSHEGVAGARSGAQILLDTSAIIDGRIADISQTGFVAGPFLIPRFVLDELQHIADSSDPLRRNRGRRGLEMLNKLRKDTAVPVKVVDLDVQEVHEVDGKLVKLAERLQCPIVTTDFNLNRVAEIQGVRVLNVNELANSLRPVLLPGEEMNVQVIQEGREHNQGVAFLDDGTMVVVEGGRRYVGSDLDVVVNRVLQTAAGRIIFCHPRDA